MKDIGRSGVALGEGNVPRLTVRLAVPTVLAQIVNLLYNLVDRIYIGHMPVNGDLALTGLGLCFPAIMLISAFSSLIGQGGAPRAAISMGRGDNKAAEEILGGCTAGLAVAAVVLTAIFEIFPKQLLSLFGASGDTMTYALPYMTVYAAGTVFVMISLGLNMFITTQGFAKMGMWTVLIGALCNIALDPLFIYVLNMGVRGAAVATVLSQAASAVWVVCFLTGKKTKLRIKRRMLKLKKDVMLPVLGLGVSPFVMLSTESVLSIALNSSMAWYGGNAAVGAMTIMCSLTQLQYTPVQGFVQGAQPVLSFNYGAGKMDRVKSADKVLFLFSLSYTFLFWLAVQLFPGAFVRLFNNRSPELIDLTIWAIRRFMAVSFIFGLQMAVQQTFVALGQAKFAITIACLRKIILLIPLIYIMPLLFEDKLQAVLLAEPVSDFISATTAFIVFALNIKKILRSGERPAEKRN